MTLAVLDARQSPLVVVSTGENTAEAVRQANRAEEAADRSEANAAVANYFPTRAGGAAGTATGELFSSDEEGAIGIYRRTGTVPNYLFLEWAGTPRSIGVVPPLPEDEDADCALIFNEWARKSGVKRIAMPSDRSVVRVSRMLALQSGQTLDLNGVTVMPVESGFDRSLGNALIGADFTDGGSILIQANYIRHSDIWVVNGEFDVDKYAIGTGDENRINGIMFANGAVRCGARDVFGKSATGYGIYGAGVEATDEEDVVWGSMTVERCRTENCNVGIEWHLAEGKGTDLGYEGGDADIAQEAAINIQLARNVTISGAKLRGPGLGVLVLPSLNFPTRKVILEQMDIEMDGSALSVTNGGTEGLVLDGTFKSTGNIGAQIIDARVKISSTSVFEGDPIGIQSDADSIVDGNGDATGTSSTGSDAIGFASSNPADRWTVGHLKAVPGSGGAKPFTGPVQVSREVRQTPNTYEGFRLSRRTPDGGASNSGTAGVTIGSASDEPWQFDGVAGKTYRLTFSGFYKVSAVNGEAILALKSSLSGAGNIRGLIDMQTGAGTFASSPLITTAGGVADATAGCEAVVPIADTYYPFAGEITVQVTTSGRFALEFASGNGGNSVTLAGLDVFEVEAV